MVAQIYPDTLVEDVEVCCWKTIDENFVRECNLKINSGLTISEILKS